MSTVPAVSSFTEVWKLQPFASDKETTNLNSLDFTIVAVNSADTSVNAQGRMQTIKVLESGSQGSSYWWGYTTQVNWKTPTSVSSNNSLYQYLILRNQDKTQPDTYLNFKCVWDPSKTNFVSNDQTMPFINTGTTQDCSTTDISTATNVNGLTGTQTPCNIRNSLSIFNMYQQYTAASLETDNWYSVQCFNMRSSLDS